MFFNFSLQKFLCKTLKPTKLPFKELYDYDLAAAFVADYLTYEVLDPPNALVSNQLIETMHILDI